MMINKKQLFTSLMILLAILIFSTYSFANLFQSYNNFKVDNAIIDINKILSGGPPKDGIPAINKPHFIINNEVDFLNDTDIVIGVIVENVARAYPTRILIWHELVNDTIDSHSFVVSYCPLCGTAMVFDRKINGQLYTFGVSGLLYQSDVLMYDIETQSLWSQLAMKSVSGVSVGTNLHWLESEYMTWAAWKEKYPQGQVLSTNTGFNRDYDSNPYASYFDSKDTIFPVEISRKELDKKSWVLGVIIDGQAKAYSLSILKRRQIILDKVNHKKIKVLYNSKDKQFQVTTIDGKKIPGVLSYWFAWQAFYPETLLWAE